MTSLRTTRAVAGRAFALLVAGLVVLVLGLTVLIPKIGGGTAYTVLTGSMTPALPPGTVVVTRPTDPDQIRVGDVVTYQIDSGRPTVATHRVTAVTIAGTGERQFITQGDANGAPDPNPVRPVQVRGVLWYSVPYVGYPSRAVDGGLRSLVVGGAVLLLFGYAAYSFGGAARDRLQNRRADKEDVETNEPELTGVGS